MPAAVVAIGAGLTTIGTAVTLGVATGGIAMAIGAVTVVGGVLAMRGMMPDLSMFQSDTDSTRQQTVKGTIEPQKLVYGEALVSGPIFFVGLSGTENKDLYHALALTGHEVEDITDIYFDNEVITDAQISFTNVTSGTYGPVADEEGGAVQNICQINRRLGTDDQTYDTLLQPFVGVNWGADYRNRGIATLSTRWRLTDGSQEIWDRKKPNNIKALVKGKKDIYDPRLDTSAGANPTNASYQQWSDNPALCVANYLTDTKFGLSIPVSKIDWAAVETAADACDVVVSVPATTQKRFTANGVIYATDTHQNNIDKLLSAMNGSLVYSNGIYTIRAGIYEAPTESLDEDDLAGPVSINTSVERGQRFNTVRTIFVDPTNNHKSIEAPAVGLTSAVDRDNGEVLTRDVQLPFTNNVYMAQRIAHKQVQMTDQQKVLTFPTNLTGLRVDVGDRVQITIAELNYSNKVFRCAGWSFSDTESGVVNLTLLEDDSGSYADPTVAEYSVVNATGVITEAFRGVPDPQNLSATAGLKNIELNWTNPANSKLFETIAVYASADSSWANSQLIGETRGTQFFHDASNAIDPLAVGDTRYYWVRALAYGGGSDDPFVRSDRNPDNDTSNIVATVGPNNPDYSDIVDDTPTQDAPNSLVLVETTVLGNDGTVLPAIRVSWTAPTASTYVSFYELQYKLSSTFEFNYGLIEDAYTATENYGSIATAQTLELDYGTVADTVPGQTETFSSVSIYGDSTVITGIKELEEYTFQIRAVTFTGKTSDFLTGEINLQGDQTAPALPENITATGGIQQIKLNYDMPTDSDLSFIEILESESNNLASAELIVKTKSDQHTVTGLPNDATRYYFLRSVDHSGNGSAYSSSVTATTQKITLDDLGSDVSDALAGSSDTAYGVQPVGTLPSSGTYVGEIVLLTTTNTLYVWTGLVWSEDIFTASSVDPGSITAASFAAGIEPISAVNSLPSPTGYTGSSLVFLTTDKKLYRYDSTVPEFTAAIATGDLEGTIPPANFASDLRPVEVVSSLPTTDLTEGRVVILTTDNDKLYRYTGTQWTKAISAADMDDQIAVGQIATDAVTAATIRAGAISTAKLDAGAVTAATVDVDELFANEAVIGAIQASSITTDAIVSTIGDFEFIDSDNIAADAITAGKINASAVDTRELRVGAVTAVKIDVSQLSAISADVGEITAGTINADVIKLDNLTMDTDANNNLVIKNSGVDSVQIKPNALGTTKGDFSASQDAEQYTASFNDFLASDPPYQYGTITLEAIAELTFTTPLTTSDTLQYIIQCESFANGTSSSSSQTMLVLHVQRTNSLGQAYDINGTRSGDDNFYAEVIHLLSKATGSISIPAARDLRGGSTVYIKLYGFQKNISDPSWRNTLAGVEALAR